VTNPIRDGEAQVYYAPVDGGEWTEIGWTTGVEYVTAAEARDHPVRILGRSDPGQPPTLTLRADDRRDWPAMPDVSSVKLPPQPGAPITAVTPGVSAYLFSGTYRRCDTCRAPVVSPIPAEWRMEFACADGRTRLTPHRPGCDADKAGAVFPAAYVHDLTLDLDRWSA
jgi:hypothetical protein